MLHCFCEFLERGEGEGSLKVKLHGAGKDVVNGFPINNHSQYGCPQICLMELQSQIKEIFFFFSPTSLSLT